VYSAFVGASHDVYVFTTFFSYVETQIPSPYFVIEDAPQMNSLKRPYKGQLTPEQSNFNYIHSAQKEHSV
jgi:hypothetical protein